LSLLVGSQKSFGGSAGEVVIGILRYGRCFSCSI